MHRNNNNIPIGVDVQKQISAVWFCISQLSLLVIYYPRNLIDTKFGRQPMPIRYGKQGGECVYSARDQSNECPYLFTSFPPKLMSFAWLLFIGQFWQKGIFLTFDWPISVERARCLNLYDSIGFVYVRDNTDSEGGMGEICRCSQNPRGTSR